MSEASAASFNGRVIPNVSGAGETIVREARERAQAAWEFDRENREDGFTDLRFAAGDQWPAAIRNERENAGRPVLTINRLPQFIYQVANDIRVNPPGIKVVPETEGEDEEAENLAKIYSGIIRSIEVASGGPNLYATAGMHSIACGLGHWRVDTRYQSDDTFDQEIVMRPIRHPFAVLWDPSAVMPAREDGEWCQVTQLMHVDTFREKYPGAAVSSWDQPIPGNDPEAGLFWRSGNWIRLIEYWRKVSKKKKLLMFGGGEIIDATKLKHNQIAQLSQELGAPVLERDVDGKQIKQSLLSAVDILEDEQDWAGAYIPIITTIGGEIPLDTKVVRFGLIRFARDPQQLYNFMRSAAAETIALAPKSPYLLTTNMIKRHSAMWNTHNTTQRPYLIYDPDKDQPAGPIRLHPPETPEAFFREQQIAVEDMKATTGIYDASLGARGNETSGVAINARDRQGDTATAHFMANLISSMVHCGRVLIDLIPRIYDTQRVIKIIGEDEAEEFVPINHVVLSDNGEPVLLNDLSQGKYQVRPRTGPSYTTKRLEAADSMFQFSQAVPGAAAIIADLIAKNMDWPGAEEIADRLKRAVPPHLLSDDDEGKTSPQGQQAAKMAAMAAELEQIKAKLQISDAEAKIRKTNADADKSTADTMGTKIDTLIKVIQAMIPGITPDLIMSNAAPGAQGAPPAAGMPQGNAMAPQGQPQAPQPMPGMMPGMQGGDAGAMMDELPTGGLNDFLGGVPQGAPQGAPPSSDNTMAGFVS